MDTENIGPVNPRNAESIITIGDEEFVLRYNFSALVALQARHKCTGKELFQRLAELDFALIADMIHVGILAGKQWPKKYGIKGPTVKALQDMMDFSAAESYTSAVMSALQGGEFTGDSDGKKSDPETAEMEELL